MAQLFARFCFPVFLIVGVAGFFLGNATDTTHGIVGGDLGTISIHLTWGRDLLDVLVAALLFYSGYHSTIRKGKVALACVGVFLIGLALVGIVSSGSIPTKNTFSLIYFSPLINAFDIVVGVVALLCVLGTENEPGLQVNP